MAEEVNEMGLLDAFNYEVEEPQGYIDGSNEQPSSQEKQKNSKKSKSKSKSAQGQSQVIEGNNNNNNNNDGPKKQKTKLTQCQSFCVDLFYWIPLRNLCFFGGVALFVLPIIDSAFSTLSFMQYILSWYIWMFAIITMFIESPTWWATKRAQLAIFFYARFLRRTSGRAFFYFTTSIVTFATEAVNGTMFAGIYMMLMSFIMFAFSILAAKQLHILYEFMSGQAINDYNDNNDDNQSMINNNKDITDLENKLANKYDKLDFDGNKKIGAKSLYQFGEEVLNRKLSNAERYTIQCYLDSSCLGYITKRDWIVQFLASPKVRFL